MRWAVLAIAAGIAARVLAPEVAAVRVVVVAAAILGCFAAALVRFEGITPAAIVRALRGDQR